MLTFLSNKATAAHLALAAVAPLVLCKYFGEAAIWPCLLWFAGIAIIWSFMAPARGENENSMMARERFLGGMIADPFAWVALALVIYSAVAALNSGIAIVYDAEAMVWELSAPPAPSLPGGVAGAGEIYFVAAVLVFVFYPSVVHALDGAQTVSFGLFGSLIVVVDAVYAYASGLGIAPESSVSYGIWALVATGVMFSAERSGRRFKEMVASLALSGCLAAMLFAGRPIVICAFLGAMILLLLVFIGFAFSSLGFVGIVRAVLMLLVSCAIAAVLFHWRSGDWEPLIPVIAGGDGSVHPLTRIAVESWKANPWIGIGAGAFPLSVKMCATTQDWTVLGPLPDCYANGWRALLAERGMIGVLALAISVGAMLFGLVRNVRSRGLVHFSVLSALLPLALAAVSVSFVFEGSALQANALVAFAALAALSVNGGE